MSSHVDERREQWLGGQLSTALPTGKRQVGKDHRQIEIVQETDYPFGERIDFTIRTKQAGRVPALRSEFQNGVLAQGFNQRKPVNLPLVKRGFVELQREFKPNDKIR